MGLLVEGWAQRPEPKAIVRMKDVIPKFTPPG